MQLRIRALSVLIAITLSTAIHAQELQVANLGDFKLESGEVLRNCRIGYRTRGTLNTAKTNALVIPTWAGGTSEQWLGDAGLGKLADTSKYFVVLIDALGNGVSSSPSNSVEQPRMKFPRISILDMVNTEYALLTRVLKLKHVKAVLGTSMGGMQTFQWMVSYPEFMDKAVSIVGSPQLASYDLLHWQSQIDGIMRDPAWRNGEYEKQPARGSEYEFGQLLLTTPAHFNRTTPRDQVLTNLQNAASTYAGQDANDKIRQTQAMMSLDVSKPFGSMEHAAAKVKARVLVVAARQDHVVSPGPAEEFARLLKSDLLVLESDCGHLAPSCDHEQLVRAVTEFLEK